MESNDYVDIKEILYISFNQDTSCFCLGAVEGFCIFNISPLKVLHNCGKIFYISKLKNRIRRRN